MWEAIVVTFITILGPKSFSKDDPLLKDLQPTVTEVECHQQAYDAIIQSMRDRGIFMTFNVTCKREEFV